MYIGNEEEKKIPHRPRSVAMELIPCIDLWAGEDGETQLS